MLRTLLVATVAGLTFVVSPSSPADVRQPKLRCLTAVIGVDSSGHVRADQVRNRKVTELRRSSATLPFAATAGGFYDRDHTKNGQVLRLDAVSADGKPRRVTLTFRGDTRLGVDSSGYDQDGFAPRLFADGFGAQAYTVDSSGDLSGGP